MYYAHTVSILSKALKATFDGAYAIEDMRNLHISQEYPVDSVAYPGIWVSFIPSGPISTVGIGHVEDLVDEETGVFRRARRWKYAGRASFTVTALSSLERFRILDELVKVLAFGQQGDSRSAFRWTIENDPLMLITANFDEIDQSGFGESQGTPWGGDEIIYEGTLQIEVIGEFVSDIDPTDLLPLNSVTLIPYAPPTESDPTDAEGWETPYIG